MKLKLSPHQWCKVKEMLLNIKCPHCLSAKVELTTDKGGNAKCEDCGCKFEFNPDILDRVD